MAVLFTETEHFYTLQVSWRDVNFNISVFVYWLSPFSILFIVHVLSVRVLLESFSSCCFFVCMCEKDRENYVCV